MAAAGGLTAGDRKVLAAVNVSASTLSLVGSAFIVLCYLLFKELRKFSFKLIFFLALSVSYVWALSHLSLLLDFFPGRLRSSIVASWILPMSIPIHCCFNLTADEHLNLTLCEFLWLFLDIRAEWILFQMRMWWTHLRLSSEMYEKMSSRNFFVCSFFHCWWLDIFIIWVRWKMKKGIALFFSYGSQK